MSLLHVQFVCKAEWMWQRDRWVVRKMVFAPVWDPEYTLVVMPKEEAWGTFTYADAKKNSTVHPLNGFRDEAIRGRVFYIDHTDMEDYLRGDFYDKVLKDIHGWDVTVGTFDMATFMYLEPVIGDKIRFLGGKQDAELEVTRDIQTAK